MYTQNLTNISPARRSSVISEEAPRGLRSLFSPLYNIDNRTLWRFDLPIVSVRVSFPVRLYDARSARVQKYSARSSVPFHRVHDSALRGDLEPHRHVVGFQFAGQERGLTDAGIDVALLFACHANKQQQ